MKTRDYATEMLVCNLTLTALNLKSHINTEWAETHEAIYNSFDDTIKKAHKDGRITDGEFNAFALIAFYDYFDLIEDENGELVMDEYGEAILAKEGQQ